MTEASGRLVLVATPIGNLGDISARALEMLRGADLVYCEDTRHSRKLFTHFGIPAGSRLRALHEHNEEAAAATVVREIDGGKTVVYITDAGMPGVSDPGARLVAACVRAEVVVEVVPGPSAVLAGLVLSGLPTDRFVFEGFLPRRGADRSARLGTIAAEARTVVCFESPHRVSALIGDLELVCGPERQVALARELTKLHETIWRGTLADAGAYLTAHEPRGEYVVVIGPKPVESDTVSDEVIVVALERAFSAGASVRDASSEVAATLDVARNRVYALATGLRRTLPTPG